MSKITVFKAKKIYTMCDSQPEATAVAVRDGIILEAGSLETIQPWLEGSEYEINTDFENEILLPGLIDPHLHPAMASVILPMKFITAFEWRLPGEVVKPTVGEEAYRNRLKECLEEFEVDEKPFITWGYHRIWHGEMSRPALDEIAGDKPAIVWQRSFHEIIVNSATLDFLKLDVADLDRHPQIDIANGRFYETGLEVLVEKLSPILFAPDWFGAGLTKLNKLLHMNGHTTVADMAFGLFNEQLEEAYFKNMIDQPHVPYRCKLVPRGFADFQASGSIEDVLKSRLDMLEKSTEKLPITKNVKLFTDGAFFGELMQLQAPGYIDGHDGEWLMTPEVFEEAARAFWNEGYQIHVHCTGNLGLELALDVLEKLQWERPRFNHRFTIEHFGVSTPEQVRRLADLGGVISANIYYLHELGDAYWSKSIGYERASQMVRLGTVKRNNVPFTLHSDFSMAPAAPLNSAWVAVNRVSEKGEVLGEHERISVHDALKAITINAAYVIGMEHEVGSIRSGKKADFVALGSDPYEVDPMDLKDIEIKATVYEGAVHHVA